MGRVCHCSVAVTIFFLFHMYVLLASSALLEVRRGCQEVLDRPGTEVIDNVRGAGNRTEVLEE